MEDFDLPADIPESYPHAWIDAAGLINGQPVKDTCGICWLDRRGHAELIASFETRTEPVLDEHGGIVWAPELERR